ncbi:YozE family protein [Sporosarcina sp. PTS2304]|uniref:YozE family protein n=1 Tax=Sporosarcina sp. PTS2304 TaxID=2283194 RepID=UPI000E0DDF88|nr:YozE family protein [Sporosarcina sp. PTS2304]AXH99205.1 YozE family protein [Sporosarcina sp. PTS2304]
MDRSFYHFALRYRGGGRDDVKALFAEKMFRDASFPKDEEDFDSLSRYIEDQADDDLRSTTFDELYAIYVDLCSM